MKINRFAIPAVVAVIVLAYGISGSNPHATIHVVEHAVTDTVADIAPAGDSIGDVLGFANPVFDEENQNQVGTDNGHCIRTAVGSAWECSWTVLLPKGQITVEGPFYDTKDSVLAITGGTGAYNQARGQMTLHARNNLGTEYDFTYEVVK